MNDPEKDLFQYLQKNLALYFQANKPIDIISLLIMRRQATRLVKKSIDFKLNVLMYIPEIWRYPQSLN